MPEGVEIEIYRRQADAVIGRTVASVAADDDWFLKGATTAEDIVDAAIGARVDDARRTGKLLVLDLSSGHRLGLRFGMTGRLIVDDASAIAYLEYSSQRNNPAWDRFGLGFADGSALLIRDPRRLGGVELDPDEESLGADVFSVTPSELDARVFVGQVAIKARLLDQSRLAGVGNLIADETLWRAGIDPARAADSLGRNDKRRLHRHLRSVVDEFLANGGSHTGRLQDSRFRGGHCPKCGTELDRRTVGGRTTYSCPRHQRLQSPPA
jgi:formamidopyrimidine-DNA glycosylase